MAVDGERKIWVARQADNAKTVSLRLANINDGQTNSCAVRIASLSIDKGSYRNWWELACSCRGRRVIPSMRISDVFTFFQLTHQSANVIMVLSANARIRNKAKFGKS